VIFGDNVAGKAPESGQSISVVYLKSLGAAGNVYGTDMIATINSPLYDVDGEVTEVSVSNTTEFLGGDDAEGIDEIRAEAPKVFATGDRLVTKSDFYAFLLNYESVVDANVWGENEESPPNYDMFNRVKICIILENWISDIDVSFLDQLESDLYDKSMVTVKYEFVKPVVVDVAVIMDAKIVKGYSLSQALSDIQNIIAAQFVLGDTTKLGVSKYLSNIMDEVDSLDSVSYHHMDLYIKKELTENVLSDYTLGATLELAPVLPGSVKVYASVDGVNTLIADDDRDGNIAQKISEYPLSGSIDYSLGVIGITFEDIAGLSNIRVLYKQDSTENTGDITVSAGQICKLDTTDIDVTSIEYDE
jgi:hypothetical protein